MPGAIWLTKLQQEEDGALTPVSTAPVDLSEVGGGKHFCAGDITPWGTFLSAEEYDADARRVGADGRLEGGYTYEDYDPDRMAQYLVGPKRRPYVYDHGWVPEVRILDADGATRVVKHYALGRFSHEIALVMPDRRTVYMSDDGVNGGLFMFVADAPDDLSAGVLYAARWEQTAAEGGGAADLDWVSLGHATDAEVAAALASGTMHFEDLLDHATAAGTGCPDGFTGINDAWGQQCLRVREGVSEAVLSRVETRRVAAMKGATTELRKGEGITFDPDHGVLYVALAEVNKGMVARNPEWDAGGPDHVKVKENRCGGVYALPIGEAAQDTDGEVIDSPFVARSMKGFVMGRPSGFGCAADALANPDNIAYLPGSGILAIAEDTTYHKNNFLWVVDVQALHAGGLAAMTPILAVPPGAEVTGLHWFPDVGGHGYLTTTVQHPWEKTPQEERVGLAQRMGTLGYFGPFPSLAVPE